MLDKLNIWTKIKLHISTLGKRVLMKILCIYNYASVKFYKNFYFFVLLIFIATLIVLIFERGRFIWQKSSLRRSQKGCWI